MRSSPVRYPVDRYLPPAVAIQPKRRENIDKVESSKKFEMVNIIDEIWNPEPALRPEDEIILRKLHEMLQSTANDLKLLSGELSKFHEPGIQIKTAPTPLDEEFNEKVHIEEVVNAKFHGYKIIDTQKQHVPKIKARHDVEDGIHTVSNIQQSKVLNNVTQINVNKQPGINRNLGITRTRIMSINNNKQEKLNNGRIINKAPTIAYNEFSYKHIEPAVNKLPQSLLQIQDMPRINIRSELKEQRVLQLDIVPDSNESKVINAAKSNVSVITIQHEPVTRNTPVIDPGPVQNQTNNMTVRKISKMSTCDSSGSPNNVSSDTQVKRNTQTRITSSIKNSPKSSNRIRTKTTSSIREPGKRHGLNLDEWKKKLNLVYGAPSSKSKSKTKSSPKVLLKKSSPKHAIVFKTANNAEYIPYSQLTLGGVRASDIEKEISDLPNKKDIPLSPILDKILSSRENSFNKGSPRKRLKSPKILTTSDENLLQEVIDIERSVSETLSKNLKPTEPVGTRNVSTASSSDEQNQSYADDFEDEKSDKSGKCGNPDPVKSDDNYSIHNDSEDSNLSDIYNASNENGNSEMKPEPSISKKNLTYMKSSNLSFKDSVDIFEFIHSVDVQDTATQSNSLNKISPKETETSPRNDRPSIQPIHNDLWPSIDPKREIEKMFQMEKDFIKKVIVEEYGDLLEKNINKPSTSNENMHEDRRNVATSQRNTQTSPARVKSVMTSPKLTKTRTTSPFYLSVPVHQQTSPNPSFINRQQASPMISVTNDEDQRVEVVNEADDISINLSSPRFSLRLPQNTQEVLSNLSARCRSPSKPKLNNMTFRKTTVSSSSSVDADHSSSELSSLGEIKIKKLRKRVPSVSECSSSSAFSKYSFDFKSVGILPLRSDGEVSLGQVPKIRTEKLRHSDGETSFDPLK